MAETAFVKCRDYQGIEFVKRLGNLQVCVCGDWGEGVWEVEGLEGRGEC